MDNKINNYASYNDRMEKSMIDKLFFLDKIPEKFTLVDFGCADSALIKTIEKNFKTDGFFVGYDTDEKMIAIAKEGNIPDTKSDYTNDWKEVIWKFINNLEKSRNNILLLSSVIHEVYSYSAVSEIQTFWEKVYDSRFDYIVIRDMIPSRHVDRPSDINDVAKIYAKFGNRKELNDFENIWGSIENNKNMMHFLLKYRYVEPNWNREVKENYIPIYRESLLAQIPVERYDVIYHEHYVLPYVKEIVRNDFGIEMKDPTHLKLILRRK